MWFAVKMVLPVVYAQRRYVVDRQPITTAPLCIAALQFFIAAKPLNVGQLKNKQLWKWFNRRGQTQISCFAVLYTAFAIMRGLVSSPFQIKPAACGGCHIMFKFCC